MESGAVFFDVDGVLIDSLTAKGEAFANLFPTQYRQDVMDFHLANGGLNRVEKIARISREIVGVNLSDDEVGSLVGTYFSAVQERVLTADEIPVIVAVEPVGQGTAAEDIYDAVETQSVARAEFPTDAVIDLGVLEGTVTRLPIEPGTVLRHAHFEEPAG